MCSNVIVEKKTDKQSLKKGLPDESLRVLASLIAQFHLKKIVNSKKPEPQSADNGDLNRG
jgi:hypothetical protein